MLTEQTETKTVHGANNTDMEIMDTSTNNQEEEATAVSLKTVMAMFHKLEERMMQMEQRKPSPGKPDEKNEVRLLKKELEAKNDEISHLKQQTSQMQRASRLAYSTIDSLTKRMSMLETNANKRMISISGLFIHSQKKDEIGMEIGIFFESQMGIDVRIDDFFFINSTSPPICVITMATLTGQACSYGEQTTAQECTQHQRKTHLHQ